MVVIMNPYENLFVNKNKIVIKDYTKSSKLDLLFPSLIIDLTSYEFPFIYDAKIRDKKNNITGRIEIISLNYGFFIRMKIRNKLHKKQSLEFSISSKKFDEDTLREGKNIGNNKILKTNFDLNDTYTLINLFPLEKKTIEIIYGEKEFIDKLDTSRIYDFAIMNSQNNLDRAYVGTIYDIVSNITIKTDNLDLNSLLNLSKVVIASAIKYNRKGEVFFTVEEYDKIILLLSLLDLGAFDILEKYIKQTKERNTFSSLYLLKNLAKKEKRERVIEDVLDFANEIKVKKGSEERIFEYLYKEEDGRMRHEIIDLLSSDTILNSRPYLVYFLLKGYIHKIPKSIKEYLILKLRNNVYSKESHLISYLEVNDYNDLIHYLLSENNVIFSCLVLAKYLNEIIHLEINRITNKIKMDFGEKTRYESKVLYRGYLSDDISLQVLYDKEKKKIDIRYSPSINDKLYFEIQSPSKEYEIYFNNRRLPKQDNHVYIKL